MESEISPPPGGGGRCSCACRRCCCSSPSDFPRSLKRKLDAVVPADVARVEAESETAALREALAGSQQSIQELYAELDAERNASASATSEAMSMILRLQREKAEAIMDARQFKRFSEEKMAHDQQELAALDDLLFKREEMIHSLYCEIQAYRHRLLSYGLVPDADINASLPFDVDYPPLLCGPDFDPDAEDDVCDAITDSENEEKCTFGQIERKYEDIETLEQRICQLESVAVHSSSLDVMEKEVLAGQSPSQRMQRSPSDSYNLDSSKGVLEFQEEEEFPVTIDRELDDDSADDDGADDAGDRVYMIDAVHGVPVTRVCEDECASTSEGSLEGDVKNIIGGGEEMENGDVKNLYSRLQVLEADRESMRQSLITMRTEKAQLMLLKEIAQRLCEEVKSEERSAVKKPSLNLSFSIEAVFKWIMSFLPWRRETTRSKYTFGISRHNAGLLLLLDKIPSSSQWRTRNKMMMTEIFICQHNCASRIYSWC